MTIDVRFIRQVLLALVVLAAVAAYPLIAAGSDEVLVAAAMGAALSTLNVVAGYLTVEYAVTKSHTTFLKAVLGGMGIRMVAMLGLVVVLIKVAGVHTVAFTVSLLACYAVFLCIEIFFIQKKLLIKNQS
jgi:hypothetical protein